MGRRGFGHTWKFDRVKEKNRDRVDDTILSMRNKSEEGSGEGKKIG